MVIDVLANRSLNFTVFAYRNTSPYLLRPPQGTDTYDWYDIDKLAYNFNRSVGSSAVQRSAAERSVVIGRLPLSHCEAELTCIRRIRRCGGTGPTQAWW